MCERKENYSLSKGLVASSHLRALFTGEKLLCPMDRHRAKWAEMLTAWISVFISRVGYA